MAAEASESEWRRIWGRLSRNPMAMGGLVLVLGWVLVALLAPWIAPYDPIEQNVMNRLAPPSPEHWLGVDGLGRDILSRVIYGGRVSLPVAAAVVIFAAIFGTLYGGLAGFLGEWPDEVGMRVVDMVLAFTALILAMAIAAAGSIRNSMLCCSSVAAVRAARRGQSRPEGVGFRRGAGRSLSGGGSVTPRAAQRAGLLSVLMAMDRAPSSQRPVPSLPGAVCRPQWGAMVAEGRELMQQWWISTFPGLAILTVAIACNFIGDGLRDAMDPRLRLR
jgi:peptide/nickel transport system permease protein